MVWEGRHPIGQLFLSSAAVAAAGAWLFHGYYKNDVGWQLSVLDLLFAAGIAVAVIQVIPVSAALIKSISPHLSTLLPCWTDGSWTLGQWSTLSLTPGETSVGIGIFVAQIILVGCVFQSIRNRVKTSSESYLLLLSPQGLWQHLALFSISPVTETTFGSMSSLLMTHEVL